MFLLGATHEFFIENFSIALLYIFEVILLVHHQKNIKSNCSIYLMMEQAIKKYVTITRTEANIATKVIGKINSNNVFCHKCHITLTRPAKNIKTDDLMNLKIWFLLCLMISD